MIQKTITYTDFAGNTVVEDVHFHLTQVELVELEFEHENGFAHYLEQIAATEDRKKLIGIFKDIVLMSYGIRTEDGRHFRKSDQIREDFASSNAYPTVFMELVNGTVDDMIRFIAGVFPQELTKGVNIDSIVKQVNEGNVDMQTIRQDIMLNAGDPQPTPPTPPPPPAPPVPAQPVQPTEPPAPPSPPVQVTDTTPPASGWVDPTA